MNEITLECGCEIEREPPHAEGCKCGDDSCYRDTWSISSPCEDHSPCQPIRDQRDKAEKRLKLAAIADLTHGTMGNVLDLEAMVGDAAILVRELKLYIQDSKAWKTNRQAELWAKVENFLERAEGVVGPSK